MYAQIRYLTNQAIEKNDNPESSVSNAFHFHDKDIMSVMSLINSKYLVTLLN